MSDYIFIDKNNKAFGKIMGNKLYELRFYSHDLYNIYRARVVEKIDSINAYFLLYANDKKAFLKTRKKFKIGDSIIGQVIKEEFDDKLTTMTANFKIENEDYYLYRFKNMAYPKLKKGRKKNKKTYESLITIRDKLIREENFTPTPKLLLSQNELAIYLNQNKDLVKKEIDIREDSIIKKGLDLIKNDKLYYKDQSIIINELETMTVIDVNSSKRKSRLEEDDFFYQVNKSMVDFIFYNIKLRNIGGMLVIDFLRSKKNNSLKVDIEKALKKYFKNYHNFGFSDMGLFEISIERKGRSLRRVLEKKEFI